MRSPVCLALVSVSLLACAPDDHAPAEVSFDPCEPLGISLVGEMSAAETNSVAEAISMWRLAGAQVDIDDAAGSAFPSLTLRFDDAAPIFYGVYLDESGEIVINHSLPDNSRRITIAHELGHAFGLAHVERADRVSLMNPGNLDIGITAGDLAELDRVWGACPRDLAVPSSANR